MTKILVKTPYFGDRPYIKEDIQPLIPYTIDSILQGSFEFTMCVVEDITQEQVDVVIDNVRLYILQNIITAKIVNDGY